MISDHTPSNRFVAVFGAGGKKYFVAIKITFITDKASIFTAANIIVDNIWRSKKHFEPSRN